MAQRMPDPVDGELNAKAAERYAAALAAWLADAPHPALSDRAVE